nr:transposon TX1 [Tanacetum cinerariifolium]
MFHNFPNSWGMGNLWMLYKKYGTVFDMFMVQKRLRNIHKYGFVRFKNIEDVELLHQRLRRIQIGNGYLRVYVAYDRREKTTSIPRETNGMQKTMGDAKEYDSEEKMNNKCTHVIEVADDGIECDLLGRSIVDEVREIEYLEKLSQICGGKRSSSYPYWSNCIREKLQVKLKGKTFRVSMIEEVSDVVEGDIVDPKLQDKDCEEEIDTVQMEEGENEDVRSEEDDENEDCHDQLFRTVNYNGRKIKRRRSLGGREDPHK